MRTKFVLMHILFSCQFHYRFECRASGDIIYLELDPDVPVKYDDPDCALTLVKLAFITRHQAYLEHFLASIHKSPTLLVKGQIATQASILWKKQPLFIRPPQCENKYTWTFPQVSYAQRCKKMQVHDPMQCHFLLITYIAGLNPFYSLWLG